MRKDNTFFILARVSKIPWFPRFLSGQLHPYVCDDNVLHIFSTIFKIAFSLLFFFPSSLCVAVLPVTSDLLAISIAVSRKELPPSQLPD